MEMMTGYIWDWSILTVNFPLLLRGVWITFALTIVSCVAGTLLAIPLTIALRSHNQLVKASAYAITELGRGTPLLVLLIWVHYVGPVAAGLSLTPFWSSVLAFSFNLGAFMADIFRGNMAAIPKGQMEAGYALGFTRGQVFRRIILQEIFRRSWSTVSALYVTTFKFTTLAAVIGTHELFFASRILNSESPHPFELYTAIAVFFLVFVIILSLLSRSLERHRLFALFPKSQP